MKNRRFLPGIEVECCLEELMMKWMKNPRSGSPLHNNQVCLMLMNNPRYKLSEKEDAIYISHQNN